MTYSSRPFTKEDYLEYGTWWEARGKEAPRYEFLASDGIIVSDEKEKLAAGFLYFVNGICVISSQASNPVAENRSDGLNFFLEEAERIAKERGCGILSVETNKTKFKERLVERGFKIMDDNLTAYARFL